MEWGDVRVFLAVLRQGSFGEAARSLGVSHPTVGRRIKALEDEAQQALFRRTREGLVLTDAGDRVLKLAEAMENSALAMERRLAGNHERLEGILRISSAEWFANYVLAPVLVELTRRHPAIVPEVIARYHFPRDKSPPRTGPRSAGLCGEYEPALLPRNQRNRYAARRPGSAYYRDQTGYGRVWMASHWQHLGIF